MQLQVQHTGSSRERLTARGQRPSPARARTPRGAAIFSAFSAFAELSTTAKPRTVGRVGSGQFDRSLRRSRVYDLYGQAASLFCILSSAMPQTQMWASEGLTSSPVKTSRPGEIFGAS